MSCLKSQPVAIAGRVITGNGEIPVQETLLEQGFFETLLDYVKGSVVVLQAYFDESQRQDGVFCVAGFAFTVPQVKKFIQEWQDMFAPFGGFHMKHLAHGRGAFERLTLHQRHIMVQGAIDVIKRTTTVGVAVSCRIQEFDALSPKFIKGFGSAYSVCCHWVMGNLKLALERSKIDEPIAYIFEAGNQHQAEAVYFIQHLTSVPEVRDWFRYHSHAFIPKKDAVPLQAADLLAWEWAKFQDDTLDKKKREMRKSLKALLLHAPDKYQIAHIEGKRLANAMETYRNLALEQIEE